ncbi:PAS domain S-box protein [Pseudalkalibacillus sp. A8]|uniref:PAS domain S-box protein n=1 Tax=Pseudalkalibacillus sp. A8 TaxID=3382641 RepID=UPI0038B682BF
MKRVEAGIGFSELAELREINSNLRQELKNYENIFNNLFCVLFKFIKRGEGKFIYTFSNDILSKQNQLHSASLVGHSVEEMFPPDAASILNENYELAYQGELVTFEIFFKDHYYLAILSPIIDNGKTIEVVGTAIDITEQKINSEKGKFTAIFNEAQDAIIFFNDEGVPIESNHAASKLFGISIENIKEGEYPADLMEHLNRSLEKLKTDESIKGETVLKRMDGRNPMSIL